VVTASAKARAKIRFIRAVTANYSLCVKLQLITFDIIRLYFSLSSLSTRVFDLSHPEYESGKSRTLADSIAVRRGIIVEPEPQPSPAPAGRHQMSLLNGLLHP
jgi:hypothetical protein